MTPPSPVDPEAPRTLAREATPRGDIALRVRDRRGGGTAYELIVGGVFAMDSTDVSTEVELARVALGACARPRRVLVGGLGLGHTAGAVLDDDGVERVVVAELEAPLVEWAQQALVPSLTRVTGDPRVRLEIGDIAGLLADAEREFDVILLDVDNGPSFLVHEQNARLYAVPSLATTIDRLAPDGVLAIWAAQEEPDLVQRMSRLAATRGDLAVSTSRHRVEREGRAFDYAIHLLRRDPQLRRLAGRGRSARDGR